MGGVLFLTIFLAERRPANLLCRSKTREGLDGPFASTAGSFQLLAFNGTDRCCVSLVRMFWTSTGQEWSTLAEAVFSLIDVVRSYADGVACGDALKEGEHRTPCITPPMEPRPWNIWRCHTLFVPGPKVADRVGYLSPACLSSALVLE
jgi:hypothetical protein